MTEPLHPIYPSDMSCGLSTREHMAIEFMKALLQKPSKEGKEEGLLVLANRAVEAAECLIHRLNFDPMDGP